MTRLDRVRVLVPALVGMEMIPAYRMALISGVALGGPDPQWVLPLRGVISAQQPAAGTSVWSGATVTIWLQTSLDEVDNSAPPGGGIRRHATARGGPVPLLQRHRGR